MSVLLTDADVAIVNQLQAQFAVSYDAGWNLLNSGVCKDDQQWQRVIDELVDRRVLYLCERMFLAVVTDEPIDMYDDASLLASICHGCGEVDHQCTCADDQFRDGSFLDDLVLFGPGLIAAGSM